MSDILPKSASRAPNLLGNYEPAEFYPPTKLFAHAGRTTHRLLSHPILNVSENDSVSRTKQQAGQTWSITDKEPRMHAEQPGHAC